jgi:hypothetical protein
MIRVLINNSQPSTTTNNIILKGREIITGGSMIIPIDINVLATIISIIKKGMNNKNPIKKARLIRWSQKQGQLYALAVL